jgi:regulator of sigma E protease
MILLAISWAEVGVKLGQLLLSLSILVILHEMGHFFPAKWFKCRVEKFYLFFNPWFSLLKKKVGETEYGIGWLPLGGFVKISGMIDESMDKEQMKKPPEAWEFRSKPAWQRLIIMIGGVTVNVIVAFIIYAMILFVWGDKKVPMSNIKNGLSITDSLMFDLGFKAGDKIIAVNKKPIVYYDDIIKKLILAEDVTIERNGKEETIQLPVNLIGKLVEKKRSGMPLFLPRIPVIVGAVPDTSVSYKAGLRKGDVITGIDSISTPFFDEYKTVINGKKGKNILVDVKRNNEILQIPMKASQEGTLGFMRLIGVDDLDSAGIIKFEKREYNFFESFPAGIKLAGDNLSFYIDQFKKILSPKTEAYKGVGGFRSMGNIFPGVWDWQSFWSITAFFSIALAFMNLLPIPALDGGHVLFTLIEMITGRKPSDKFLEYAQVVGMVLLLGLMLYANGNDWFGWGKGK